MTCDQAPRLVSTFIDNIIHTCIVEVRHPVERRRVSGTAMRRVTRAFLTVRFIAGTPSAPAAVPLATLDGHDLRFATLPDVHAGGDAGVELSVCDRPPLI